MNDNKTISHQELSDEQALMLSKLAYLDLSEFGVEEAIQQGESIEAYLDYVEEKYLSKEDVKFPSNGGMDHAEFLTLLNQMADDEVLGNLTFLNYDNDNVQLQDNPDGTGFVAYAFSDTDGNTYFTFTGSEGNSQKEYEEAINDF